MLQVSSDHPLREVEAALRRAAARHGASIQPAVHHVGHLLADQDAQNADDAIVFTICHHELFAALLAADIRVSALIPCRIAAYSRAGRVTMEAMSPLEFGRLLNRPDLAPLASSLEDLLRLVMEDAASQPAQPCAAHGVHRAGLGATEDQVNVRGSIPQRIDRRGTKVEELGGTGEHDAQGG